VAQENYSESRTAKGAGSNRSSVYTDNNLDGPNSSSVFALSGQIGAAVGYVLVILVLVAVRFVFPCDSVHYNARTVFSNLL
jgi:hypothetical protein